MDDQAIAYEIRKSLYIIMSILDLKQSEKDSMTKIKNILIRNKRIINKYLLYQTYKGANYDRN